MHIATLLPPGEYFEQKSAGAVSLFVRDFIQYSRYEHSVLGRDVETPLLDKFYAVSLKKWPWQKRNIAYAKKAKKVLQRLNPDQVDIHNRLELFDIVSRSFKTNLYFHNDPLTMRGSKTLKKRKEILKKAHKIFCVSHYVKNRFLEGAEDDENKVIVMPNGVLVSDVSLENKEKIILFVGRLIEEKGVHLFVEAVENIYEELSEWRFVMIGANRPGQKEAATDFEKAIVEKVKKRSARFSLQFFTPYDEVIKVFHQSMIVVVPSLWDEPFGRIALEGIATKNAVVTTGRGGLSDICDGNAVIDPHMSVSSLSKALLSLATSPERLHELRELGYKKAHNNFDIKYLSKELDQCRL